MTTTEIQKLRAEGWTLQRIADKAGVSHTTIWKYLHIKQYKAYRNTPRCKAQMKKQMKLYYQRHKVELRARGNTRYQPIKLALAEYRKNHPTV